MKFSIIIPVYNEEKAIGQVLDNIKKLIAVKNYEAEIIVVDDGSKDKTAEVAKSKNVKILQHKKNSGYGAALKTGIEFSNSEVIAIIDGDGSYPVEKIPALLNGINEYEMVVGARTKIGAEVPFLRKIPKYFLTKLASYLMGANIPDVNSGFRIFKKSIYKNYINIIPDGFSFTLTITLSFIADHKRVKYIPISYNKRKGISKIRPVYDTINFVLLIIRTVFYFNSLRVK